MVGHPKRAGDYEIHCVSEGYVVYQEGRDRVHYLNHTALLVFEFCDGTRGPEVIASALQELYGLDAPPRTQVEQLLADLTSEGLVLPVQCTE